MYNITIGKRFVNHYNKENGTNHTCESFFYEFVWPNIFDHKNPLVRTQNGLLMNILRLARETLRNTPEERQKSLETFLRDIDDETVVNSKFPMVYVADPKKSTYGQRSFGISGNMSKEEKFASLIGYCFAVSVDGFSIFINDMNLLNIIFEGWKVAGESASIIEKKMDQHTSLHKWNSLWLCSQVEEDYTLDFNNRLVRNKDGEYNFPSTKWIILFASLAKFYKGENSEFPIYVFKEGETNKTIGFILVNLGDAKDYITTLDHLYGDSKDFRSQLNSDLFSKSFLYFGDAIYHDPIGYEQMDVKKDEFQKVVKKVFKKNSMKDLSRGEQLILQARLAFIQILFNRRFQDMDSNKLKKALDSLDNLVIAYDETMPHKGSTKYRGRLNDFFKSETTTRKNLLLFIIDLMKDMKSVGGEAQKKLQEFGKNIEDVQLLINSMSNSECSSLKMNMYMRYIVR